MNKIKITKRLLLASAISMPLTLFSCTYAPKKTKTIEPTKPKQTNSSSKTKNQNNKDKKQTSINDKTNEPNESNNETNTKLNKINLFKQEIQESSINNQIKNQILNNDNLINLLIDQKNNFAKYEQGNSEIEWLYVNTQDINWLNQKNKAKFPNLKYIIAPNLIRIDNVNSCKELKYGYFPKVTYLRDNIFTNSKLVNIDFVELEHIGNNAFARTPLESITAPKLKKIGLFAFLWTKHLSNVNFPKLEEIESAAFSDSNICEISALSLVKIGDFAFQNTKLTNVSFPKLKEIGNMAFKYSLLSTINAPLLSKIGDKAFFKCPNEAQIKQQFDIA
ncbi:leucine-rich repeat protein [Mycoplasma sp. NEAQ87857]|uniref:leucine-rich repeat domain-containing protein n=1 Tax=Mycoplasma sp. NEAQ87857 TaxID=2683967 RepID=UPI0013172C00|nr:leucine-rich repeat domain-containing protein [Mycoplasma sp. NEAQ87857]QGZ97321.1 leucine-rich repeat protein [Mycoplasma sp. NEAQ87857]